MALPITKFLEDMRKAVANFKAIHEAICEYFALKNQMLLELSSGWSSGTKTVPNVSKYETIEVFPYTTIGGVLCQLEPDGYFRGSAGMSGASSVLTQFEFAFSVSGDKLTIDKCRFSYVADSNGVNATAVYRIRGVEPKLPDALKNIIGGGYYIDSLLYFLERRCSYV